MTIDRHPIPRMQESFLWTQPAHTCIATLDGCFQHLDMGSRRRIKINYGYLLHGPGLAQSKELSWSCRGRLVGVTRFI